MYGKLKNLSIEELEVEIEDLDLMIKKLTDEKLEIMIQISNLQNKGKSIDSEIIGLRALIKIISDRIQEKQKEEAQ